MIRRLLPLILLLLLCGAARAEETAFYTRMPEALRATQSTRSEEIQKGLTLRRTYPKTSHTQVTREICALVDELARQEQAAAAQAGATMLDVGAVMTRTGTSWMSFLTLAEATGGREMLGVAYEARVYDMETGERVALTDVLAPESGAYALLAQAVREQLGAAFPGEEPDAAALDALCAQEALEAAQFTLGAASLTLTYRADAVYPGKHTLLHVRVGYSQLRPMMTERAQAQTDNSRFRMVALTYDDGGAQGRTRGVLDQLRCYGAQATFFIVGQTMGKNHDVLCRQHNAGYSLQTHTYTHEYTWELTDEQMLAYRDREAEEMSAITGVSPTLMRAPGGAEAAYVRLGIGYPLIHWSFATGDSSDTDVDAIVARTNWSLDDGDIVLMHDTNVNCAKYTRRLVESLTERGYLLVTVEELFEDAGVALEPGRVYYTPQRIE